MTTTDASPSAAVIGLRRLDPLPTAEVFRVDREHLLVATDRVIAHDMVLPGDCPGKGDAVNQLAAYWFEQTRNLVPSRFLTADPVQIARIATTWGGEVDPRHLGHRAMLVNGTKPLPIAVRVVGYLHERVWDEYQATGRVGGHRLPEGLSEGARLPTPLYVPRVDRFIEPGHVNHIERASLALYAAAEAHVRECGLSLAEASLDFGLFDNTLLLIGYPFTPDSALFRDPREARHGIAASDDAVHRELLGHLQGIRWQGESPAPPIPADLARRTGDRYGELYRRITGLDLE